MGDAKFVGVDGCPAGWFSVGLGGGDDDGFEVAVFGEFRELVQHYSSATLILVDIPIGLRECGPEERQCDKKARGHLKHQKSSVFRVPVRKAVHKKTREAAAKIEQELTKGKNGEGKSIGSTAWGIVPKIAEVDRFMIKNVDMHEKVREVHPELLFWALNGEKDMRCGKKTLQGFYDRMNVLRKVERRVDAILEQALPLTCDPKVVGGDDILDALAAAVTARLGTQAERLQTLPARIGGIPVEVDLSVPDGGLPMEMVYYNPPDA